MQVAQVPQGQYTTAMQEFLCATEFCVNRVLAIVIMSVRPSVRHNPVLVEMGLTQCSIV